MYNVNYLGDEYHSALECPFCSVSQKKCKGPYTFFFCDKNVSLQKAQNISITFVQCWTNVKNVGPTLYKCYANILCLLGKPTFLSEKKKVFSNFPYINI